MKQLWIILGSVVTVAVLTFGTFNVVSLLAHEEENVSQVVAAAGIDLIDVAVDNGSIEVTGGDVDEVTLEARISRGLRPTGHDVRVEGSTLVVRGSCPIVPIWCSTDYRLVVPDGLDVEVSGHNGELRVRSIDGDVRVEGHNGQIELSELAGSVVARTHNGRIEASSMRSPSLDAGSHNGRVSLTFVSAPTTVRATSNNGRVEVVVPDGPEAYAVDVATDHGSQEVAVRTDPRSDRTITARTDNGSIEVRYSGG